MKAPTWILLFLAGMLLWSESNSQRHNENWPGFRGPGGSGTSSGYSTPTYWDVSQAKGVRWKTAIPGLAHSSPVIWGNRVFVTTAISRRAGDALKVGLYGDIESLEEDSEYAWKVYCLDKRDGRILWEQTAHRGIPKIKRHPKSTHANPTPVTDGRHLVAYFGSEGLYCYSLDGTLLWKKDLGVLDAGFFLVPDAQWGVGSSPVLAEDVVVVQADVQQNSFLAAFRVESGEEIWRVPRFDVPTWSTPAIGPQEEGFQVVVNGFRHIGGYDLFSGAEVWKMTGGGDIPVPTPVLFAGLIYITNAHGSKAPIYAIRSTAQGNISLREGESSNRYVVWSTQRQGAYMQTPLVVGDYLYNCRDNGVLACYKARTGERVYQQRLGAGGGFSASGVSADQKLYYTSEEGDVYVVRTGPTFELLSINPLGEICMATPAISEGVLYFRTRHHLVAISE